MKIFKYTIAFLGLGIAALYLLNHLFGVHITSDHELEDIFSLVLSEAMTFIVLVVGLIRLWKTGKKTPLN